MFCHFHRNRPAFVRFPRLGDRIKTEKEKKERNTEKKEINTKKKKREKSPLLRFRDPSQSYPRTRIQYTGPINDPRGNKHRRDYGKMASTRVGPQRKKLLFIVPRGHDVARALIDIDTVQR